MSAINAAKIALHMSPEHTTIFTIAEVLLAAERLATIEETSHFAWHRKPNDWETTCANIAVYLTEFRRAPSDRTIRDFINQKGQ